MSDFSLTVREEGDLVIIETSGYLADLLKCAAVDRPRLIERATTQIFGIGTTKTLSKKAKQFRNERRI